MVTIMTPLSLPTDIQQQTIYTVVSKPVRRSELIWGRMIGYMAIVTVLVLVFGGISLFLPVAHGRRQRCEATELPAKKAKDENRIERAQAAARAGRPASDADAGAGADQGLALVPRLARHAARGRNRRRGGTADERAAEPHRGGDASAAIWRFGRLVPDPFSPPGRPNYLNRQIPVEDFIFPDTVEWQLDRVYNLAAQIDAARREKEQPNVTSARVTAARRGHQPQSGRARARSQRV